MQENKFYRCDVGIPNGNNLRYISRRPYVSKGQTMISIQKAGLLTALTAIISITTSNACLVTDDSSKLKVVATTSIIGDVIKNIGGDRIDLTILLPPGLDPHGFEPTPRELAAVFDADIVFLNGFGLEQALERQLAGAGSDAEMIYLSDDIEPRILEEEHETAKDIHDHSEHDPHVWMDPNNVITWARRIAGKLAGLDPVNSTYYKQNAEQFENKLLQLLVWIREQVARVPENRRKIVCDHLVLGYFAGRYGFQQIGAVVPSFDLLAEPSSMQRAELENKIKEHDISAIFVSKTSNPKVAHSIAEDLEIKIVPIYTGSLSEPGGEAGNYIAFIRYNVEAIINALNE